MQCWERKSVISAFQTQSSLQYPYIHPHPLLILSHSPLAHIACGHVVSMTTPLTCSHCQYSIAVVSIISNSLQFPLTENKGTNYISTTYKIIHFTEYFIANDVECAPRQMLSWLRKELRSWGGGGGRGKSEKWVRVEVGVGSEWGAERKRKERSEKERKEV